jgi:hypothetical protein
MLITGDVVFADGSTSVDIKSHDLSANGLKLNGTLVTASATELNIMDGVTRSTAQINAARSGTVTSVATGTGLTGGTITSSGTISINTTAGGVGTYAFLARNSDGSNIEVGRTYTNSSSGAQTNNADLVYAGMLSENNFNDFTAVDARGGQGGPSGVWRAMGGCGLGGAGGNVTDRVPSTLFLRIS